MNDFEDNYSDDFLVYEKDLSDPLEDQPLVETKRYKSHVIRDKDLKFNCKDEYNYILGMYTRFLLDIEYQNKELQDELDKAREEAMYWKKKYYDDTEYDDEYLHSKKKCRYYDTLFHEIMEEMCHNDKKIEDLNYSLSLIDQEWRKQKPFLKY